VPVDPSACGAQALKTLPRIEQIFVNAPEAWTAPSSSADLFMARRRAESWLLEPEDGCFYVCSLSAHTLSYKGMVMPEFLPAFYPDLRDERMRTSVCVFHQRFSTNTLPQWRLAQPFRLLAHNGEINTIQGNRSWSLARSAPSSRRCCRISTPIQPLVSMTGSDSSSLDNMLEVMLAGGMDVLQAMRMLIPPAWQTVGASIRPARLLRVPLLPHGALGRPAGIVLTDGRYAACTLDRNGLRPARYVITRDRHITIASEVGVYEYPPESVVAKGRLGPGEMLAVDLRSGELLDSPAIDELLKRRAPYKKWLREGVRYLDSNWSTCMWPPSRWSRHSWPSTRRCSTSATRSAAR
jgi:glutamate synthase (NADPH) large chain